MLCPLDKADSACCWPITSIYCKGWQWVELYLHSPHKCERFHTTASTPSILANRCPRRQWIVQQLINNKIIHSAADSDYNYLTKFNRIIPYCTESNITPIDCTTLSPANYTQRGSSTAPHRLHTVKTRARQKTHPTPHTMCHRHRPPHLTKTSPHT